MDWTRVRLHAGPVFSFLHSVQTALVHTQLPAQLNVLWESSGRDEEPNSWSYASSLPEYAVAQLVEALRYKSEGRGFDSRWCH